MIYVVNYMMLGALSLTGRAAQQFLVWVAGIYLLVFVGARFETGCDWLGYQFRIWNFASTLPEVWARPEPLFQTLVFYLADEPQAMLLLNAVAAVITLVGFFWFASRREYPLLFLALCFPILFVQLGMSGIRQAMALGMFMLALEAFVSGRRLLVAAFIAIGSLFHTSVIVFLPLAFIVGVSVSLPRLGVAAALALPVMFVLGGDRFDVYTARYLGADIESSGVYIRVALILPSAVFFMMYQERYRQFFPRDFELMRIMALFCLALVPLMFVSSLAAHRFYFYALPVNLLILMRAPFVFVPFRAPPYLLAVPFLMVAAYQAVWLLTSRHARICYMPYESYLF